MNPKTQRTKDFVSVSSIAAAKAPTNLFPVKPETPADPSWIRFASVAYMTGRGFTFGVDGLFPPRALAPGKFAINCDTLPTGGVVVCDKDFEVLAERAFDWCYLGPRIDEEGKPERVLKEAYSKLKLGAHLIIHVSDPQLEPDALTRFVADFGSWQAKDRYFRDGHHVQIFKKIAQPKGVLASKTQPSKRACIVRYGAIGDMVMVTPLIKALHEDGYSVTVNCTEYALPVIENNPYVSNIILQEKDIIPNPELGSYWKYWEGRYDKYINLSESIEGGLLKVEGRTDFFTTKSWRHRNFNVNYYDRTLAIGGYANQTGKSGEIFTTAAERQWAAKWRKSYGDKSVILWSVKGSSHHKHYPLLQPTLHEWLDGRPDAQVILLGHERDKIHEFEHPQVERACGKYTLRQVMAMCEIADLIVGPESAITNFSGCFDTPKIVLLSHSTEENLTKYWRNCTSLVPQDTPCYPCHQLHYSADSCPQLELLNEDNSVAALAPACTLIGITPTRLMNALSASLPLRVPA